ncbi:MAG: hypothetical protein EOM91_04935 [Sphingobacteriia bacterium]|nr:hypothetical protein [Sphingobacteriia bacterium]NCC39570.1 hypothetical protein [Gammaproteobacteria bacterium]
MTTSKPPPVAAGQNLNDNWSALRDAMRAHPAELKWLGGALALFLLIWFLPVGTARFDGAVLEGLELLRWYAREHVLLCLVPAFFIAGAIAVFLSKDAVINYLGPKANRIAAYGVASVSGSVLAVCSCTVLPLFGSIYRRGAGLGPAIAFLYAGPAINILAIILTARILGLELGLARALGAVVFALVIGLIMHWIYRDEERERAARAQGLVLGGGTDRPVGETLTFFVLLILILILANWAPASADDSAVWHLVHALKWPLTALAALALALLLTWRWRWPWPPLAGAAGLILLLALLVPGHPELAFTVGVVGVATAAALRPGEGTDWLAETLSFAKLILPLLLAGILVAGFLLGRPGHEGMIPSGWIAAAVGGNDLSANLLAALVGALMYFATLTEIPIVQGLLGAGMGQGPALALLLAGPALSLPNLLVIRGLLGTSKTLIYCALVVVMATISGLIFGAFYT